MKRYNLNECDRPYKYKIVYKSISQKIGVAVKKRKKALSIVVIVLVALVIGSVIFHAIKKEQSYYGEYYLTSTGNKYHEDQCIFVKDKTSIRRMTVEEFESGEYEPCDICLPHD